MQLTCQNQNLIIKTGKARIQLDDVLKVGEVEISGAGEYEVAGIFVQGVSRKLYSFWVEGMLVVFFELNKDDIEKNLDSLNETEILILKNGGGDIAEEVSQTLARLEPKVVVPLGFERIDNFVRSEGQVVEIENYKISKTDLTDEGRKIVILPCSKKA